MSTLTTLFENLAYQRGLISGHGLSYLLETPDAKILFDTGPSDAFLNNAAVLGKDISGVDALVISHGHYDHTGGLSAFLAENSKAPVYIKKDALKEKYKGYDNYIGIPSGWEKEKDRFRFVAEITEISPGVFVIPETPLVNNQDTHFSGFNIKENDHFLPDEFDDELFMAVRGNDLVNIISGCSHKGITNAVKAANTFFNLPSGIIIGGFHLNKKDEKFVASIAIQLEELNVKQIEVSHCTGIDQYHFLRKHFQGKVFYNHAGKVVII